MKNVMLDLETLGTSAGCSILSIGAIYFDQAGLGQEFYQVISKYSCGQHGLSEDAATLKWWSERTPEARQVLEEAELPDAMPLTDALIRFNAFLKLNTGVKVWGNGADFDNSILIAAYRATGVEQGWGPWCGRCYRTLKSLVPNAPNLVRVGVYHNALDDAKSQALHAIELVKYSTGVIL